jgi:hypothetical protein
MAQGPSIRKFFALAFLALALAGGAIAAYSLQKPTVAIVSDKVIIVAPAFFRAPAESHTGHR